MVCAGKSIDLSVKTNGTSQSTYQWQFDGTNIEGATSNVLTLSNVTIENAGDYNCVVSDYGFETISEVAIVTIGSLELDLEIVDVACQGDKTASIVVTTTNGVGALNHTLKGVFDKRYNQLSNTFDKLSKGSYTIIVNDELGCSATIATEIVEPTALSVKLSGQAPKCNGGNDAIVEAIANGGTAPYEYKWSNGETTQSLTGVADTYSVIVTDANGCTTDKELKINEPAQIDIKIISLHNERNADQNSGAIQVSASKGVAPYEYTFGGAIEATTQSSGMLDALNHGVYSIMATDAKGCSVATEAEITARYYKPEVDFSFTTDGLKVVTVKNTRAATSYEWNFGDETIIKAEAPSHTYKEYRQYYVSLTATNDYGSKTVKKLVTLSPKTSINQTMESGLSIKTYPNPSNGKFTLSYSSSKTIGDLTVKIRNTTGQLISTETFKVAAKEMSKEFDINGIDPGLYFVETISKNGISTQQIVIK